MEHFSSFLRASGLAVALGLLSSCGSEDGAPHLSTIQFGPSGATANPLAGGAPVNGFVTINVTILGPNGQPLSDTEFLLSGANGSTVYEGDTAVGATPIATPSQFKTGAFGSKMFTVGYTVEYTDKEVTILEIWSGSAYNRFNVTVECVDNPPATCP